MKAAVIVNGGSGAVHANPDVADEGRLRSLFAAYGWDAVVRVVEGQDLEAAARDAADSADVVVAAGGDGTVSAVAGVLAGGPVPLGVLAVGTLNHFAKDAGVPLTLEDAVRTVATGEVRSVDVAEVNGRVFINNSSVGLYPAVVRMRDEALQQNRMGKWRAMAAAAFRVFRRFPVLRLRIESGEEVAHKATPVVFIGNNEYQMALFNVGKRSCLDQGRLCVYYADCTSRLCIIRLALGALFGTLKQDRDFKSLSGRDLWIEHHRRSLYVSTDGEVVRLEPPLHYRIRPGALRVVLPRAEPADGAGPETAAVRPVASTTGGKPSRARL